MLIIRGMEVTQAIQYYRSNMHLTDPSEQLADNAVPLVCYKPAWVRVYVESDSGTSVVNVSGTLTLTPGFLSNFHAPIVLAPQPPGQITAGANPNYVATRTTILATLNFIIPAHQMLGHMSLTALVSSVSPKLSATQTISISVPLIQTLKVRGVLIGYDGADPANPGSTLTIAAPTLADLQTTASWALRVMPVQSQGIFEVASTVTSSEALTGTATNGGCTQSWIDLNGIVSDAKTADGNLPGYVYYGLTPANYPNTSNVGGCEWYGVSAGPTGSQVAMAHEIGHFCGLSHAPCGSVGSSADPTYPAYPPYDTTQNRVASIGEFGLDVTTGDITPPNVGHDYMSYCGPGWASLFNYAKLTNNDALNPDPVTLRPPGQYVAYDPWWWLHYQPGRPWFVPDPGEEKENPVITSNIIIVIGVINIAEEIEIRSIKRAAVFDARIGGATSPFTVRLHGEEGALLSVAPLVAMAARGHGGCGCGCGGGDGGAVRPMMVMAHLADVAPGTALSITDGERIVWERKRPKAAASVKGLQVKRGKERLRVTFDASWPRGVKPDAWLRVSDDRGRTWKAIATHIEGYEVELDPVHLPVGSLLFQVVVHDGFHSITSESVSFRNEAGTMVPAILHPNPRRPLIAGEVLYLWGSVAGTGHGRSDFVWSVNDKQIGKGLEHYAIVPSPGRHICRLDVLDAKGRVARSAETDFESVSWERPMPRELEATAKPKRAKRGS